MQQDLFEYAVIRIVPLVEREEFLNVGVILYCGPQKFLGIKFMIDENRLRALNSKVDVNELTDHLKAFEKICIGGKDGGAIGQLPTAERFRWLTASRSTIVQTSKVHPGLTANANDKLEMLFSQLVAV
jgi:hypothetical protein